MKSSMTLHLCYPSKDGGRCYSEFPQMHTSVSPVFWRVARTSPPSNSSRCLQTEGQKKHSRCKCPMMSMDLINSFVRPFQKVVELLNLSVYVSVPFGVWSHAINSSGTLLSKAAQRFRSSAIVSSCSAAPARHGQHMLPKSSTELDGKRNPPTSSNVLGLQSSFDFGLNKAHRFTPCTSKR